MRRNLAIVLIAFFVGAIGSIFFDRVLIPYLATLPGLSGLSNLTSNSPIVINRREEVQIDEGVNLLELAKQAQAFTVSLYAGIPSNLRFAGNGIILTSDGVIFASRISIGDAKELTVVLNDGRSFPGLVRALDPKSELAVITITANNLSVAQFDDAGNMQVAQRIFALGKSTNEFTRQFTSGNVMRTVNNSANPDQVFSSQELSESFGTSLALNSDFVGSPVLNLQGKIVALVANSNGKLITSEGINQILGVYLASGKVTRPYWGLRYASYTKTYAQLKGFPQSGALVAALENDSPALAGGLRVGDYILSVDGTRVENNNFERLLNHHQPGTVRLSILRVNNPLEITFTSENR